ncbi:MAG: hypothetical protein WKF55_03025 [Gemmatimonadaceae bacterium]
MEAAPSATLVYRAATAQRDELQGQLRSLVEQRHGLLRELEDHGTVPGQASSGMQQRIGQIDLRIADVDKAIVAADLQVARAASIPGAVTIEPPTMRDGPPREALFAGGTLLLLLAVMVPISIAYARRIWRKNVAGVTELPRELIERFSRLEQTSEATALEVERIGEGQRFVTRLMTERADRALSDAVGVRSPDGS